MGMIGGWSNGERKCRFRDCRRQRFMTMRILTIVRCLRWGSSRRGSEWVERWQPWKADVEAQQSTAVWTVDSVGWENQTLLPSPPPITFIIPQYHLLCLYDGNSRTGAGLYGRLALCADVKRNRGVVDTGTTFAGSCDGVEHGSLPSLFQFDASMTRVLVAGSGRMLEDNYMNATRYLPTTSA
jgi:hypothetical protein